MNKLARSWVKALRSGDYKQDRLFLRTDRGYCCLGVACDVAIKNGIDVKVTRYEGYDDTVYDSNKSITVYEYDSGNSSLPDKVVDALGIKSSDGYSKELQKSLTTLNDSDGLTFSEIADYIETNQEKLFNEIP